MAHPNTPANPCPGSGQWATGFLPATGYACPKCLRTDLTAYGRDQKLDVHEVPKYRGYIVAGNGPDAWVFRAHTWDTWSAPVATLADVRRAIDAELDSYSTGPDYDRSPEPGSADYRRRYYGEG